MRITDVTSVKSTATQADVDAARAKLKSQIQANLPKNPLRSCTVSKGVWYDAKKSRYRASIGSYRSKWFWTQDGAEKHREEKLIEINTAKRIAKLDAAILRSKQEIEKLEREKCEVLKR